jgi:hypothetical protein
MKNIGKGKSISPLKQNKKTRRDSHLERGVALNTVHEIRLKTK